METTNTYCPEKGYVGFDPARNILPGSEQLLMPHEESKPGMVVQVYFPAILSQASCAVRCSKCLNKNDSSRFNWP